MDVLRSDSCGRLAPSPTGAQHLGNARTYLIAWLHARLSNARLLLRIEDLDTPRTKSWATQQAIEDLAWLGLDWDSTLSNATKIFLQSERGERYQEVIEELTRRELIYPCVCTRKEIESASSAPHETSHPPAFLDGPIYPGTCSHRSVHESKELTSSYAWRFRTRGTSVTWVDKIAGKVTIDLPKQLGDFVIHRSSGEVAYQLAVVVDDHDQSVTQVVRGNDLIPSAARQIAIYECLGWNVPTMIHVPLVRGHDGRRLAKRHGDTRLSQLRDIGLKPESIIGAMAWSAGLLDSYRPVTAKDLLSEFRSEGDLVSRIAPDDFVIPETNAANWIVKLVTGATRSDG